MEASGIEGQELALDQIQGNIAGFNKSFQRFVFLRFPGKAEAQRFLHVTLPGLGPMLLLVSILTMAGYFQLFAEPYVMTQGGPVESTVSVLYFMYEQGFKWWNLGFASAVAFILFVIMFAITAIQYRFAKSRGVA